MRISVPSRAFLFRWKFLFAVLSICICAISLFPSLSMAETDEEYKERYGPLNMGTLIGRSIEEYIAYQQNEGKNETEVMGRGYMIDEILLHQWIITRSMVHGFTGFQQALDRMRSEEVSKAIMLPTAQAVEDTRAVFAGELPKTLKISDVDLNDSFIQNSSIFAAHKRYTDILEEVNKGGFFGGETIFKKMQFIGAILLVLTSMISLGFLAWKSFTGDEPVGGTEWFKGFFRLMFLFLFIMFIGKITIFGLSMADGIKGYILTASFPAGANGMSVVMDLMDARMDFMSIKMSMSITDFFTSGVSTLLAYGLGWIAYFLASAAIFVLIIAGDVMMALTVILGPIVCALSLLPGYENTLGNWFKGYTTLLFYGPLAAVYVLLLVAIMTIGIDTSPLSLIIISVAYIQGAMQIPHMARNLSGTVMAGLAIGISAMPAKIAASGVSAGVSAGARSAGRALRS